jgi:ribosomal protein L37AE/L43A
MDDSKDSEKTNEQNLRLDQCTVCKKTTYIHYDTSICLECEKTLNSGWESNFLN